MTATRRNVCLAVAAGVLLTGTSISHGVIPYWQASRAVNPPQSCYYANSGWQYEGQWSAYLGTPIAPNYFITAKHVNGSVGGTFTYNGQPYTTVASFASPDSDLRIWQVSGTFPSYAPLYTASGEVGQTMTVFGRGTQRGSPVVVGGETKGWYWGPSDGVQSWGSNKVTSIQANLTYGSLLHFDFDTTGDWYESALSVGDSGGGVFLKDGGTWKLAGINLGVDGPFSLTGVNGSGFNAAIYDLGGLYYGGDDNWTLVPDEVDPIPTGSDATRISSNLTWIQSVIGPLPMTTVPEPATAMLLLIAAGARLAGRARRGIVRK